MEGFLYVGDDYLGEVDFTVIDTGMGGIGGNLVISPAYERYRKQIQALYEAKGIANIEDFDFRIVLVNSTILNPEGGIGVTDSAEYDEIYVEAAGIHFEIIEEIKSNG